MPITVFDFGAGQSERLLPHKPAWERFAGLKGCRCHFGDRTAPVYFRFAVEGAGGRSRPSLGAGFVGMTVSGRVYHVASMSLTAMDITAVQSQHIARSGACGVKWPITLAPLP